MSRHVRFLALAIGFAMLGTGCAPTPETGASAPVGTAEHGSEAVTIAGVPALEFRSDISPKIGTILYLHGGSYRHEATVAHSRLLSELVQSVGYDVVMPQYTLAPVGTATLAYDQISAVFDSLRARGLDGRVTIMGDSAGGGFALGFAQSRRDAGLQGPDDIVLLSPWLDASLSNPEIVALEASDSILNKSRLIKAGLSWAGDLSISDYRVSPLNGDLTGLAPITMIFGTNDILYPDSQRLLAKAHTAGITVTETIIDDGDHRVEFDGAEGSRRTLAAIGEALRRKP
jgi:monoterpene epsilon-lactone hydrolase